MELPATTNRNVAVEVRGVGKVFPGVVALEGVGFSVGVGEVHGVIGENGAGKSTLMKVLSGLERPSSGEILLFGRVVDLRSPREAQAAGVAMIHQELNLVDDLSVADNLFLGRERTVGGGRWGGRWWGGVWGGWVRRREQEAASARVLSELGCEGIRPGDRCGGLSIAQKQMVEIGKALLQGARVLILDEPTAVLTGRETRSLFERMSQLKRDGVAMLFISHHLDEVLQVCDRVTVLRDGKRVTTLESLSGVGEKELARLMVGRPMEQHFPAREPCTGEVVLEVRGVEEGRVRRGVGAGGSRGGVSFEVRAGEIFGLAGLIGAGRTELCEAIAGLRPRAAGEVRVKGYGVVRGASPAEAVAAGVAYLSEDRKGTGLTLGMSVRENLTLASLGKHTRAGGWLSLGSERATSQRHVSAMAIRTPGVEAVVGELSGGNQQKVALAKWLETSPRVLLLDEPTRGVDIGAKEQIYRLIQGLTREGMACVLVSSELNEVLGLCHRIGVMRAGRIVAVLDGATATEQQVMEFAAVDAGVGVSR